MRDKITISKWGNSLAVRIPLAIARQANLGEGDSVTLGVEPGGAIVMRPARKKYELSELVDRITPKNRHEVIDWGGPQGKEVW